MLAGALMVAAGLAGTLGVSLSAMAAHLPQGAQLAGGAQMLLFHAPAFLALAAAGGPARLSARVIGIGALLWGVGLVLFAGDMSWRAMAGVRLFPHAAPVGGTLLIAGWLWLGALGLISLARARKGD